MTTHSLLSEQLRAERALRAGRGEEAPHERRNSQTPPPSRLRGATAPLERDGPPLHPVLWREHLPTDRSDAIKPLRRASTAPEIFHPSELKTSDFDSQRGPFRIM